MAPRLSMQTRVALKTEKAIFFMESLDLSRSGIRLQSEVPIEIGTHCRLVPFFDDVNQLFEASGTVVRVRDVGASSHMGIRFDALSPAEEEALLSIMNQADVPSAVARA